LSNRPSFRQTEIFASAARTASPTSVEFYVADHSSALLVVDVTAGAATPSVVPSIEGYDPVSGNWFQLHENISAITSTSAATYSYLLGNFEETEGTGGHDMILNGALTRRCRVKMTHADADSLTYSVGLTLIP
jgi:hypothetical protein